jgi:hypothetical protein
MVIQPDLILQLSSVRIQFSSFLTVPNSENSPDTSNPTVTKLLEADAFLATQEVELNAQLQSIHEKRRSLKTVIDLFAPTDTATATPIATPAQTPVADESAEVTDEQTESTTEDVVTPEPESPKPDTTTDAKASTVSDATKRQTKKNSAPAGKKPSAKSLPKKTNSEQETWQQYLREEFSNATLATAVSEVMQRQPKQVLEIAAIVEAIFVDEIPSQVRSKARERVSNVLSVGVKKEKWYRGEVGSYSMSKAAVENSAA